ncbi:hypothetical protein [Umezawaea beigongshangensis]|uniref:hypothetical protein n=1 Tax=Umezawaea beigongshangensis TaxID=2780383 RepID=UPI0018F27389|nr:hypothetical protein [Umezawaea beigongshangensis]
MIHVPGAPVLRSLNSDRHRTALLLFAVVVAAHWAEHVAQAVQVYVLGMPVAEARGVLGVPFPWLVHSEWMHYGYALVMMIGLFLLRPAFVGRARTWWTAALVIQVWHHFEHLLLLVQALSGANLANRAVPTSLLQFVLPRVELHLFYNAIVFVPMVVAMVKHASPTLDERAAAPCRCAVVRS